MSPGFAAALRRPGVAVALLAVVLALAFLGSRGIWDPDEGRYTNVALNMLDSGDWLNPRRNHEVGHWTKPPLTYWAIASSVGVFGYSAWAARLPVALSYLLCVYLAWRIGARLVPQARAQAAVVYATMLLPFGASQLITTDYVLAAAETLAMWGFVEARFGVAAAARRWLVVMWTGFAFAFLTKGPPGLLPLLVVIAFDALVPQRRTHRVLQWSGIAVFVLFALPWYAAVVHGNPGLFRYFVGDEVVNRVTTNEFGRHGEWYAWLTLYGPTLIVGTLPWTPALVRWARRLPGRLRAWRHRPARGDDAAAVLLALWVLLPLLVFCVSRSRMPLYVLPLFTPIALLIALERAGEGRAMPPLRRLVAWAGVLLALKAASVLWPTHKNAAGWAEAIDARVAGPVEEVVFVEDMARYGLHLHLGPGVEIEKIGLDPGPQPRFNPPFDEPLAVELAEGAAEHGVVWVCKQALWPALSADIASRGYRAVPLGAPYRQRVLFRVEPAPATTSTQRPPMR